jgi:hypothetical protein
VVRRVSTWFVPVAVNLYQISKSQDAGGDLFRSAQRQKPQYQGLWIIAPDGRALAAHQDPADPSSWAREVQTFIDKSLASFGPLTPRRAERVNPLPFRGVGVRPDGGISLAIEVREMIHGRPAGDPVIDSLTLTPTEASALAPPSPDVGTTWTVPGPLVRRFSRILSSFTDQSTMPRPEEATDFRLTGTVRSVENGVARLSFTGRVAASHTYDGKTSHAAALLTGAGRYDLATRRLTSFVLISDGKLRSAPPYDKELHTTAAVVEWSSRNRSQGAVPAIPAAPARPESR